MPPSPNLEGTKHNKLFVIKRVENTKKKECLWECLCDCGKITYGTTNKILNNSKKSCGCYRVESAIKTHFEDLSGRRFGKLVAIKRDKNRGKRTIWMCKCDCGKTAFVEAHGLKGGTTRSCGCLKYESKNEKHGKTKTRLYSIWSKMKDRCTRKNNPAYKWYGGRGIVICKDWINDFMSFYNWAMENGYNDNLSIDRIDVNGNYEPSNCRWILLEEQALNTRATKFLTYKGETKTVSEWCEITGIKKTTMLNRIRLGFTAEECIEIPVHTKRQYYKVNNK